MRLFLYAPRPEIRARLLPPRLVWWPRCGGRWRWGFLGVAVWLGHALAPPRCGAHAGPGNCSARRWRCPITHSGRADQRGYAFSAGAVSRPAWPGRSCCGDGAAGARSPVVILGRMRFPDWAHRCPTDRPSLRLGRCCCIIPGSTGVLLWVPARHPAAAAQAQPATEPQPAPLTPPTSPDRNHTTTTSNPQPPTPSPPLKVALVVPGFQSRCCRLVHPGADQPGAGAGGPARA